MSFGFLVKHSPTQEADNSYQAFSATFLAILNDQ